MEKILKEILKKGIRLRSQREPDECVCASGGHQHKHPHREAMLVLEGENDFLMDGRGFHLKPGDAVLIDSWAPHSIGYRENDRDLLHIWFFFTGKDAHAALCRVIMNGRYEISHYTPLPSSTVTLVLSRWNELNKLAEVTDETMPLYLESPMRCLTEDFLFSAYQKDAPSVQGDLASAVKLYIESRIGCDCSLAQLEKVFGYSRFYIAHKFRDAYGLTPGAYISKVRMAFTEVALIKGLKQKEIAEELGFSSAAAFWKWRRRTRTG